ncbi:MAG: DUF4252 domain-containing protein [Bacteroidota bacterium]
MKKLAILAVFVIAPIMAWAQGVFDSYENEKEVTTVVVTKNMFKILGKVEAGSKDSEAKEYLEMINGLENVKIYMTENESVGSRMKSDVKQYVSSSRGLEELMRVKKDDANLKVYSKQGSDDSHISELLLFAHGEKDGKRGTVVASITGNINLKHISKLTTDLSLPSSDFAVYPNPASDQITIDSKDKPILSVIIFDSTGKKVYSEDNLNVSNKQISISNFAKGMYFVSVNNQMSQKILKK